jgi:hypothetical protein
MKASSCKSKGRRLQQDVARSILRTFPHLQEDDVRSTSMGAGGEDVQLSAAARQCMPYSIECKNTERLALWSAIDQCEANTPAGATPLIVFKRNRSKTYAVLPWEQFMVLQGQRENSTLRTAVRSTAQQLLDILASDEDGPASDGRDGVGATTDAPGEACKRARSDGSPGH